MLKLSISDDAPTAKSFHFLFLYILKMKSTRTNAVNIKKKMLPHFALWTETHLPLNTEQIKEPEEQT